MRQGLVVCLLGRPEFRAFRDCCRWREDARATTKAGLDRGRDQRSGRLLHAYLGQAGVLAASRQSGHAVGADLVAAFRAEQRPRRAVPGGCWSGDGATSRSRGLARVSCGRIHGRYPSLGPEAAGVGRRFCVPRPCRSNGSSCFVYSGAMPRSWRAEASEVLGELASVEPGGGALTDRHGSQGTFLRSPTSATT